MIRIKAFKFVIILFAGFLFIHCDSVRKSKPANTKEPGFHYSDSTLVINKKKFRIHTNNINEDEVLLTVFRNSKVVMSDTISPYGLYNIEFPDFNGDGNNDILLSYSGNISTYQLYLFDKINNTFRFVEFFDKFPEAVQLEANPKYYYSYHRAGCADYNWVSDLFYFQDYKAIHIGHIYGQGCDDEEEQVIEIYQIYNNDEENYEIIDRLPFAILSDIFDKWNFIENYWNKNYENFIIHSSDE